jgi:uncharacterized protein YcbK (DUF882 family)
MLKHLWDTLTFKSKYFKPSEFRCKCKLSTCDTIPPQAHFLKTIDLLRERVGSPLIITSGCRCVVHNQMEGGAKNSAHLYGLAADIDISMFDPIEKLKIFTIALDLFEGVGIGNTIIHVDLKHATKLKWEYDSTGKALNFKRF